MNANSFRGTFWSNELSDEAWQMVTSQPRVTGFLGGKGRPVPITDREAERLIRQMDEVLKGPAPRFPLILENRCALLMAHLHHSMGMLRKQMMIKRVSEVAVSIFGRSTLLNWNIVR